MEQSAKIFFTVVESTVFVAATTAQCIEQRIYIYKEYKAKSPRLHIADIYPRKQEAVRQTTPELLSAVLRSLLCGV